MKQVETFKRSPSDMSKKSKNIRHDELIDHSIGKKRTKHSIFAGSSMC